MNKDNTPDFLRDSLKFGIKLGLERMIKLSSLLGNPQERLKFIHIAGTNGKGSTVTYISTILAQSELRVGVFTSPFLERFSERMRVIDRRLGLSRMQVNEQEGEISKEDLDRLSLTLQNAVECMISEGFEHPTEFELVTVMAFLWFAEKEVDVVVLETGLGGRFDSTNIIEKPICCGITTIGLDHTDVLGNTLDDIAYEKAGIIKQDVSCFVSSPKINHDSVMKVFLDKGKEVCAPIFEVDSTKQYCIIDDDYSMRFKVVDDDREFSTFLLGEHQIVNAALAIKMCDMIRHIFPSINDESIVEGIRLTRWKGRFEIISRDPLVILDGGHNPQCMTSLVETLDGIFESQRKQKRIRMLIGVMKDKDFQSMLEVIKHSNINVADFTCVRVDNPRSMAPLDIGNMINLVYNNEVKFRQFEDAKEGCYEAIMNSKLDGIPLIIAGSLYLIGQAREAVKESV